MTDTNVQHPVESPSTWRLFLVFLRLGLTSFGGPVAHIGYFRDEFVTRRRWLTEHSYGDLVALCQFLPGPASSQVGLAIGLSRGGYRGALAAWGGFTLPSALIMVMLGLGVGSLGGEIWPGVLSGLKTVAVAVVAQAVWGMARTLCPDPGRMTIMAVAACLSLLLSAVWGQLAVIAGGALAGLVLYRGAVVEQGGALQVPVGYRAGSIWLALFLGLLLGLPLVVALYPLGVAEVVEAFYRSGSLVFGGGHVILPLLQAEVVPTGWVDNDTFLAGYGAAQALPGPLFTFSAFLGSAMASPVTGWVGGLLCLLAIFLPSFLLVAGALPFWERLRGNRGARAALMGTNAAVVGLLLAALYDPVWTTAILGPAEFCLALLALVSLVSWKLPPWLVVAVSGLAGGLVQLLA